MADIRFVPNRSGIDELQRGPDLQRELRRRADRIADAARASAPVLTGEYRDSIHVEEEVVDGKAVARVVASSDHAIYVEAETGNMTRSFDAAR